MLRKFFGGTVVDPTQQPVSAPRDLWVRDGHIIEQPSAPTTPNESIDVRGLTLMAGAIDLHTHIGGGKLTIARTLLPERWLAAADHVAVEQAKTPHDAGFSDRASARTQALGYAPSTFATGYAYARMGYTACFEPAMLLSGARQAHLEMADIPLIDKGGYVVMGNDPLFLRMLQQQAPQEHITALVDWTLQASGALAVKVVNPGGIDAFKFHARHLNVDEPHPRFGVTPRDVISALTQALDALQLPHPLHVHCSNLGIPGNWQSTLATVDAAAGRPIHLTHVQFHSYGNQGPKGFSSQAAAIAELVNRNPHVSIDIGQVIFGQTVTVSADVMHQFSARKLARPRKWVCSNIESSSGCGAVPFRYRDSNYVHALQWAIGLELLLLVEDPWRVFLTTDHPNGGPFTSYPHLIRMLMDRTFRESQLERIHPEAAAASNLKGLTREYTLEEIAILTRAAPARILGLSQHGHLRPGAIADIVAYRPDTNIEQMFSTPAWVFRRGEAIVQNGNIIATPRGTLHRINTREDHTLDNAIREYYRDTLGLRIESVAISNDELAEIAGSAVVSHPRVRPPVIKGATING